MSLRKCIAFGLLALAGTAGFIDSSVASQDVPTTSAVDDMSGLHAFDFLVGEWRVHNRRLKVRLAGSTEWEEFEGTIVSRPYMGGWANVDDTEFRTPEGLYRGVAPRAYDPKTGQWAIWWIDGRNPFGNLDPPVKGRFVNGVGTFYADRHSQRKADQDAFRLVAHHADLRSMGTGVFRRWREDLGDELGAEARAGRVELIPAKRLRLAQSQASHADRRHA